MRKEKLKQQRSTEMEPNRRPRIVKRTPLYKRIIDAPEDYTMKIGNDIRAMDWDMLQEGFSWPLALSLNLLLASVKMGYWLDDPLANVPNVLKKDRMYSTKSMRPAFASLDKQILFEEVSREYNAKFVHPRIFVRKFDKQVSTVSTETDLSDSSPQPYDKEDSFELVSDCRPRKFQHLSVPRSSFPTSSFTGSTRFRGSSQLPLRASSSRTSSSESSEDAYEDDNGEDEKDEEDASESEDGEEGIDPDVEYDEEGEEPAVPHPTNALNFS
ncbi:hypothetical protein BGX26_009534 [Mortierella sp. AD094]|nr:hypothetical protein BGX26_009534 [Mortierella sp. AD094]